MITEKISPLLIIRFKKEVKAFGITVPIVPVPIYLDEKLTQIATMSASRSIDINNETVAPVSKVIAGTEITETADGEEASSKEMQVFQKGINNSLVLNFIANNTNVGLNILLPLLNLIFTALNESNYGIDYIDKNFMIFNAKLGSFLATGVDNGSLINIAMTLIQKQIDTKGSKEKELIKNTPITAI